MGQKLSVDEERIVLPPEERQRVALAVLSLPMLQRMDVKPGRETRRRVKIAESLATIEDFPNVMDWANATYRTKGARRG